MTIRFFVNNAITHENVGELDPATWSYGEPLTGVGEANLVVPMNRNTDLLKRLEVNDFELMICEDDPRLGGSIQWAGWLDMRDPQASKARVEFHAVHWKNWLYKREIPPGTFTNNFMKKDEHQIVYDLLDFATNEKGTPVIPHGTALAGVTREFTVSPWQTVGSALDEVGKRDGGYEWSIGFRIGSQSGRMEMFFELWEPGAVRSSSLLLLLDNTRSTNKIAVGNMKEDGSTQYSRVYATSDGDEPVFAKDDDPTLASGTRLLLERHTTYQDNRNAATLYDYARGERVARQDPYTTLPVTLGVENPRVSSYRTGDRARLRIRDGWRDLDETGVRITNKSVSKSQGKPAIATVELDMTDIRTIA